ncbi:MAG: hypothetical protein VXW65_05555 [Pseudomonadota bacterium]|nr:hypothetical protein [Pseudomonadota bacterium]
MNEKLAQMIRDLNLDFEHDLGDSVAGLPETIGVFYPSGMSVCYFTKIIPWGYPKKWAVESDNQLELHEIEFIRDCLAVLQSDLDGGA